ncbi:MAG: glycosyltransferase family 2 protein [Methanomassiliicoccales archaeon]
MEPLVSVIITAFNRKEFLSEALDSLAAQTADRDSFEIIVVKNFKSEEVERKLQSLGAISLGSDSPYLPPFSSGAIDAARGQIICFLDDDDLFEPEKVETVIKLFKKYPDAGYYHNSAKFINERGEMIRAPYAFNFSTFKGKGITRITHQEIKKSINKLIYFRHDFNRSCISVKKEVLEKWAPYAHKMQSAHDSFIFYCAAMSGKSMLLDEKELTRYRLNKKSVSLSSTYSFTKRQIMSYTILRKMAEEAGEVEIQNLLERQLLFFKTMNAIHDPIQSRKAVMRAAVSFLGHSNAYNRMANSFAGLLSFTYMLSPTLSKKLYSKLTRPTGVQSES